MSQIYWLLVIAVGVLSSSFTVLYMKKNQIKQSVVSYLERRQQQRDKRFKLKYKRIVRVMVREYLKELQDD